MDLDILKIDLDIPKKQEAIKKIDFMLSYFEDIHFYKFDNIENIILIKKKTYGCVIKLKKKLKDEKSVVLFQLLLGSDPLKETNTLLNHYMLNMQYSNRLFTTKRYKNNKIIEAKTYDITELISKKIKNPKRKKNFN